MQQAEVAAFSTAHRRQPLPEDASTESITQAAAKASEPSMKVILLVGDQQPETVGKDDGAGSRYALFLLSDADAERLTGRRKFQRPRQDGNAPKNHGNLRIKAYGTIGGHSVAPWRDHHVSADEARHIVHAAFGG